MTKERKAKSIVTECDAWGVATIAPGIFLETSASMQAQAAGWNEEDPGRALDFSAFPYWLTTDNGTMPQGITGAGDTTLLDIIE